IISNFVQYIIIGIIVTPLFPYTTLSDLDVGQLDDKAALALVQRVAACDDRRDRLDARALRHLREIRQHERHADRRQHRRQPEGVDRKSTRLNSSHVKISYAVFCLKKKIK